jgi:hypothetical protein
MWRDSVTIRRWFCPLHSLDGWRVATVIKRMAIRSPMAWREASTPSFPITECKRLPLSYAKTLEGGIPPAMENTTAFCIR